MQKKNKPKPTKPTKQPPKLDIPVRTRQFYTVSGEHILFVTTDEDDGTNSVSIEVGLEEGRTEWVACLKKSEVLPFIKSHAVEFAQACNAVHDLAAKLRIRKDRLFNA